MVFLYNKTWEYLPNRPLAYCLLGTDKNLMKALIVAFALLSLEFISIVVLGILLAVNRKRKSIVV